MSFQLLPKSVTLNDLERRNSLSPNSVAYGTDYVKVVGDTPILSAAEIQAEESSFQWYITYGDIGKGSPPSESVKVRHSPLASEYWTITWKRCKIGDKLLLISNRKSYMSFRLVPKLLTLNDIQRRNGACHVLFHCIPQLSGRIYEKGFEDTPDTFCGKIFIAIFAKVTENECVMHRRSHVTGCYHYNITYSSPGPAPEPELSIVRRSRPPLPVAVA